MIYLTTGANGAGKTLCTLQDVRKQQLAENRPVYYHGFDMDEAKAKEFGWIYWEDPRQWMKIPEGAICLFDECQEHFGKSGARDVPQYILDLAKYRRKRGIDMWLITPHPTMLHVDVRRLIEKPSWHRHFKRAMGADVVSCIKFSAPDLKCEEPGSGERGEVSMRPYPKEVYTWYRSASLHTGKRQIPRRVYVLAACALLVPALFIGAFYSLRSNVLKRVEPTADTVAPGAPGIQAQAAAPPGPKSPAEYVSAYAPRVPGLPHTAPAYDTLTQPRRVPYPAACIASRTRCQCYTQDGTLLTTEEALCRQLVERGFFADWQEPRPSIAGDNSGGPNRPPVGHPEGVGGGGMGLQGPMSPSRIQTALTSSPAAERAP